VLVEIKAEAHGHGQLRDFGQQTASDIDTQGERKGGQTERELTTGALRQRNYRAVYRQENDLTPMLLLDLFNTELVGWLNVTLPRQF